MVKAQHGFSLMELLVAMVIVAVFGVMVAQISQWLGNSDNIVGRAERIEAIQKTVRFMSRDLRQVQPRPVRDILGQTQLPSLVSSNSDATELAFTTAGWLNPLGLKRSELQRVAYLVRDNQLLRWRWPVLDPLQDAVPIETVLLDNVNTLTWRFLTNDDVWVEDWPPTNLQTPNPRLLPKAVEWRLTLNDWGELVQLTELPR